MSFRLKNVAATYQRLVNKMFDNQIGRNMEVYVDDMLVKSKTANNHVSDLEECFGILRRYDMKLNRKKCTFGVASGKFMGFIVNTRGIEANPEKIRSLLEMLSPRSRKEVQSLTGKVAALNHFISKSIDKCLPFYNLLRGYKKLEWTEECEQALLDLKMHLVEPLMLSKPISGEPLFLYLAVTENAVNAVLV